MNNWTKGAPTVPGFYFIVRPSQTGEVMNLVLWESKTFLKQLDYVSTGGVGVVTKETKNFDNIKWHKRVDMVDFPEDYR